MIRYADSVEGIEPGLLLGFFEGWPNPPAPETHLEILTRSDAVVLAVESHSGRVVGFITAITDGVLCAYIPLLEVLPEYRKQGIGAELVRRLLERLGHLYMIDLVCDPTLQPFYSKIGMTRAAGMVIRNYQQQAGRKSDTSGAGG